MVRGTSAADEIATGIARTLGIPRRRLLRRRRATPRQNEVPADGRQANVRGAFRPRGRPAGRRLLLVDDVCTTGATLAECRRILVEAGASAVYAAVIARADGRQPDAPEFP
jgi:predicted amidophosphoribosyltransferase